MHTNLFILINYAHQTKSREDILAVVYETEMRFRTGKMRRDARDSIVSAMEELLEEVSDESRNGNS